MSARLTGIRDFLLLFFFIDLGARLDFSTLGAELVSSIWLSLFVLIGNPLIVMAIMGYMGYRKRTGFMAGLTVAQISEFSIVFVAMGIALGHIGVGALSLTTLVGLVTNTLSTYMILYSQPLYERLSPWLGWFERQRPHRELAEETQLGEADSQQVEVLMMGVGRYGSRLLSQLRRDGVHAVGVDFDPEAAQRLTESGLPVLFGDSEDPDFLDTLPLSHVRWVVSALPQWEANRALLHALQAAGFAGQVAVVARDSAQAQAAQAQGVALVFNPFDDAADHAARHLADMLQPTGGHP